MCRSIDTTPKNLCFLSCLCISRFWFCFLFLFAFIRVNSRLKFFYAETSEPTFSPITTRLMFP
jgi:hypothetical protein